MKLLYLLMLPLVSAGTCNDADGDGNNVKIDCGGGGIGRICSDLNGGGYTCACDVAVGYWGPTKTNGPATCGYIQCDDANGDESTGDNVNCGIGAKCENNGGAGYKCTCESGFTGSDPDYNMPATCFETCTVAQCGGNATCSDTGNTGHTCACDSGFTGDETVNRPATCVPDVHSGCAEDEYVSNHTCKNCSMLTRKKAGGLTSGEDTSCVTKDWVVVTASALGGSVLGVGGVLWWHYTQGFKYSLV